MPAAPVDHDVRRSLAQLRAEAARCRRLAGAVDHAPTAMTLTAMAAEYDDQAAGLQAAEPGRR